MDHTVFVSILGVILRGGMKHLSVNRSKEIMTLIYRKYVPPVPI